MSGIPNDSSLLNELVTFIQNDIPALEDGQYQLSIAQSITDSAGKAVDDGSMAQQYTFAVRGDRFRIADPSKVLFTLFPADGASGEYTTVLPHAVFKQSTFPWARVPTDKTTGAKLRAAASPDVPTWLAILLLDEDDLAGNAPLALAPKNATIRDLFPKSLEPKSSLGDNYSYFWQSQNTILDPGDTMDDVIQVLDVPLPFFWQLAPTLADLKLSAHVREVSLIDKPTIPGTSDVGEPTGKFSIVFGNRLPNTKKKTYAYLVSLEELQDFLPTDEDGGAPAGTTLDSSKFLRLAVLKSWTFYSTGSSATFVDQLLALNGAPKGGGEADFVNLVLPYSGSNSVVQGALTMGYTPLNHDLRTAEKTVSWYRGPLAPYLITDARVTLPVASPDQATIFDPTTGMFDMSYSVAWTIGRLLALQDSGFSTALYNWKRGLSQSVLDQVENGILSEAFSGVFAPSPAEPQPLTANALRDSGRKLSTAGSLLLKTMQALSHKAQP